LKHSVQSKTSFATLELVLWTPDDTSQIAIG